MARVHVCVCDSLVHFANYIKKTHSEPILNWMSLIKLHEIIHQPKWRLIESLGQIKDTLERLQS